MLKTWTIADQVTNHLREEILKGRWIGTMPGRNTLVKELGVDGNTVVRALSRLEKEGLLEAQGKGKARRINSKLDISLNKRVSIIYYEPEDLQDSILIDVQHQLKEMGHTVAIAPKTLRDLKHDPKRVMAMIKEQPAEAIIAMAAPKQILQALSESPIPAFALFGRMSEVSIAGAMPDSLTAMRESIRHLHQKGHRRIVKLSRPENLEPELGVVERAFLSELENMNLAHGPYNLPHWDNTSDGFHQCLDQLFQVTPPTAIFVDEWALYYVIQNYLANLRGKAYRDTVCVSMDYHASFTWCQPGVPHFYWDYNAFVRKTVQWVNSVAKGKEVQKQHLVKSKFVDSGLPAVAGA